MFARVVCRSALSRQCVSPFVAVARSAQAATRVNNAIRAQSVRLVGNVGMSEEGAEGEQKKGSVVVSLKDALERAKQLGMDLVEVDRGQEPVVCRICDFGQERYKQKVKHKTVQKAAKEKAVKWKEVRIGANAEKHDVGVAVKKIENFLEQGNHVKVTVRSNRTLRERRIVLLRRKVISLAETLQHVGYALQPASVEGLDYALRLTPGAAKEETFTATHLLPDVTPTEVEELARFSLELPASLVPQRGSNKPHASSPSPESAPTPPPPPPPRPSSVPNNPASSQQRNRPLTGNRAPRPGGESGPSRRPLARNVKPGTGRSSSDSTGTQDSLKRILQNLK